MKSVVVCVMWCHRTKSCLFFFFSKVFLTYLCAYCKAFPQIKRWTSSARLRYVSFEIICIWIRQVHMHLCICEYIRCHRHPMGGGGGFMALISAQVSKVVCRVNSGALWHCDSGTLQLASWEQTVSQLVPSNNTNNLHIRIFVGLSWSYCNRVQSFMYFLWETVYLNELVSCLVD